MPRVKASQTRAVSYEEEDTCVAVSYEEEDTRVKASQTRAVSYEEEDTCVSYYEEDTIKLRFRVQAVLKHHRHSRA